MPFLDGQNTTRFVRSWLQQWLSENEEQLNQAIDDADTLKKISKLPEVVWIDDDGDLHAGDLDRILKGMQYGSAALGLPRLGILDHISDAVEKQATEEIMALEKRT